MELPPGKYVEYLAGWQERARRAETEGQKRGELGRALAQRCAALLAAEFGARNVWLFGSMVGGQVGPHSDVHLLVEGVSPEDFFRAWARCEQEAEGFVIDMLDTADRRDYFRRSVEENGAQLVAEGRPV